MTEFQQDIAEAAPMMSPPALAYRRAAIRRGHWMEASYWSDVAGVPRPSFPLRRPWSFGILIGTAQITIAFGPWRWGWAA